MALPHPADNYIDIEIDKESLSAAMESIKGESVLKMFYKMGTQKNSAQFKEYRIESILATFLRNYM